MKTASVVLLFFSIVANTFVLTVTEEDWSLILHSIVLTINFYGFLDCTREFRKN